MVYGKRLGRVLRRRSAPMVSGVYVYCPRPSNGAKDLVAELRKLGCPATRLRRPNALPTGSILVNWGAEAIGSMAGTRILNPRLVHNKYRELELLKAKGVLVPPHSREKVPGYLARLNKHQEANDLLANLERGDYYVQYVPTTKEFRVHVLNGISIRAGIKVPRTGDPHPRFRSWQAGWKLDYGTACQQAIRQRVRDAAKQAVAALEYDFGAVDLGITERGEALVFEVNTAPGMEGNTLAVYAAKLKEMFGEA